MHTQPGESLTITREGGVGPGGGDTVFGRVLLRITPSLLPMLLKSRAFRAVQQRMGARLTSVSSLIESSAYERAHTSDGQAFRLEDLCSRPCPTALAHFPTFL